jgi:hypothetical protein
MQGEERHDTSNTWNTGAEVWRPISGRLLHDPCKGRGTGLSRSLSPQPIHQLNDIDPGGGGQMSQVSFIDAEVR